MFMPWFGQISLGNETVERVKQWAFQRMEMAVGRGFWLTKACGYIMASFLRRIGRSNIAIELREY